MKKHGDTGEWVLMALFGVLLGSMLFIAEQLSRF